jgi:cobalt-zinc-cadmium efflux system membrane fusion protein
MSGRLVALPLSLLSAALLAACGGDDTSRTAEKPQGASAEAAAFCEEHQIAEAQCPWCHPDLVESLGWCKGHEVAEAFCYQCNPALVPAFKAAGDWCAGHDRPESQCYVCNPELDPASKGTTDPEQVGVLEQRPPGPDVPRSQIPPAVHCSTEGLVVQFDSADIAGDAGLELVPVEQRSLTQTLECNARLDYDGDLHSRLSSAVPGIVSVVHHDLGDAVEPGEPLVTIRSAELGAAKAAYLQALAALKLKQRNHAREADLLDQGAGTEKAEQEAETELADGRIAASRTEQELRRLGLSTQQIDEVARREDTSPTFVLSAPFAGRVVERETAVGEVVRPEVPLVAVADVSRMWAMADVYESDILDVQVGQSVVLQVEGLRGRTVPGRVTWVSSHVDSRTRTLQARVEVGNPDGLLRANMFAKATIAVRDHHPALVVPVDAVQWEGCCNVVFVKRSEVLYEPRKVMLGVNTGRVYEVLSGVRAGEEVVTQGSFLLKTEILKGSIGAGCCEVDPGA